MLSFLLSMGRYYISTIICTLQRWWNGMVLYIRPQKQRSRDKWCSIKTPGSSSDGEPGVFKGSMITCFFNVRAQFPNRTRTVPRHMLQYGRNEQQQLRFIHIHERIAMIIFFVLYKKQFNIMTFNGTIQC